LDQCIPALAYYQQAIAVPLSEAEVRELGRMRAMMVSANALRAGFAANAREAMAECLLNLGRNDAAQQAMVEAADIREQHGLGRNALLAGRTQAASGESTIEGRIIEAESKSENDPEYWRERALYFRGQQEFDREEEALKKGLSLTKPEIAPQQPGRRQAGWRSWLLSDYAHFLARHRSPNEAVALLRRELADAPAMAESAVKAAHLLAFEFRNQAMPATRCFGNGWRTGPSGGIPKGACCGACWRTHPRTSSNRISFARKNSPSAKALAPTRWAGFAIA
jgi:tetratricopeptide (TPR) repeat protein